MNNAIERNLGDQPLAKIMATENLKPHDLVAHSKEQISHKMVARGAKGRRLTQHVQYKILNALNAATKKNYSAKDLFNY